MKRFFILISALIIIFLVILACFSVYQIQSQNRLLNTQQSLQLLKDKTFNLIINIDKNADEVMGAIKQKDYSLAKRAMLNIYNEISNYKSLVKIDYMVKGCIRCHGEKDPNIINLKNSFINLTELALVLHNELTLYLSSPENLVKVLHYKSELRNRHAEIHELLQNMHTHINEEIFRNNQIYNKLGLGITIFLILIIFFLVLIFYKKIIKDIDALMRLSENLFDQQKPLEINPKTFKNKEIRDFVELLSKAMRNLYEKEKQLQEQMEEISSMNDELQASNQQMEMLTFELEEARENLENIVKEKTKELQRAYKELQELDNLKSNFLHSISHEFKTPLTPLFGYLKLFKNKDLGELTPLQEQSIDIMLTCAEKLYNTIEDIILLARLDVEKEKYILKEIDLSYLLKNTLTRIEKELSEKRIILIQDIPNIPIVILGEQLMLIQTFLHILRNSIKFTPEKGTIRVILNQEEKNAVVRIIDTGTGLPEKIVNEINEYLASQSIYTNKRGDAITIGLNLMKRVIIIHNANVRYKSEKGIGTEVIFTFPLKG